MLGNASQSIKVLKKKDVGKENIFWEAQKWIEMLESCFSDERVIYAIIIPVKWSIKNQLEKVKISIFTNKIEPRDYRRRISNDAGFNTRRPTWDFKRMHANFHGKMNFFKLNLVTIRRSSLRFKNLENHTNFSATGIFSSTTITEMEALPWWPKTVSHISDAK